MKPFLQFTCCVALVSFVASCSLSSEQSINDWKEKEDSLNQFIESLNDSINKLNAFLLQANEQVAILSYPADQRLAKIEELFGEENYDEVKREIDELKSVFPNAKEVGNAEKFIDKINDIEAAKIEEAKRLQALGFKALTPQTSFTIDYNKITISNIKVSNEFVFDSYDDYYHYRDADRGTKFVSAAMSVTSTEHDPHLPQLAIYRIDGGEMQLVERFMTRYANWRDYGAYLGNYRDSNNDFSKVSTVKFKVGVQVSNEILEKPYAIIIKKENGLYSSFDRYDNPPMSYNGNVNYPSSISVQDFSDDYILIKLCNLK